MSTTNRAERIEQLFKALKKYYKPTNIATDRPVLDLLLYACCLEDAKFDAADEAFAKLQQTYFDWNEVRVTTVAELGEVLSALPNPSSAANRIKKCLQSIFESRYGFDLEETKKANLGKTTQDIEAWNGVSKFILGFVVQNALGGHSIPVDNASLEVLKLIEIVSGSDASKGIVPGLERTIAKTKGPEFATLLHQFAAEFKANSKSTNALAVFKDLGVNPKPPKPAPPPPPPPAPKKAVAEEPAKPTGKPGATSTKNAPVAAKESTSKDAPKKGAEPKVQPAASKETAAKDAASKDKLKIATKEAEAKKPVVSKTPETKKPSATKPPPITVKSAVKKPVEPAKPVDKKSAPVKKEPPKKEAPKKEAPKKEAPKKAAPPPKKPVKKEEPKVGTKSKPIDKKFLKKKPK